jgi:hypothetical protein
LSSHNFQKENGPSVQEILDQEIKMSSSQQYMVPKIPSKTVHQGFIKNGSDRETPLEI